MTQISVSQFRQNLPSFLNRVYAGEEFLVVKNKIPVASITPVQEKKVATKKILPGATKLMSHLKGSTIEIADKLRREAWYGKYAGR